MNRSAVTTWARDARHKVGSFVAKGTALGTGLMLAGVARAQTTPTGIDALFDTVDLSGIEAKVMALALVIVAIALAFKGPTLVKRIISKI